MYLQFIRYTFAPADAETVAALFSELQAASRKEPGVVTFDVARSEEQPHVFMLWEVYKDRDALTAHTGTEHFKRLALNGVRTYAKERSAEFATILE